VDSQSTEPLYSKRTPKNAQFAAAQILPFCIKEQFLRNRHRSS